MTRRKRPEDRKRPELKDELKDEIRRSIYLTAYKRAWKAFAGVEAVPKSKAEPIGPAFVRAAEFCLWIVSNSYWSGREVHPHWLNELAAMRRAVAEADDAGFVGERRVQLIWREARRYEREGPREAHHESEPGIWKSAGLAACTDALRSLCGMKPVQADCATAVAWEVAEFSYPDDLKRWVQTYEDADENSVDAKEVKKKMLEKVPRELPEQRRALAQHLSQTPSIRTMPRRMRARMLVWNAAYEAEGKAVPEVDAKALAEIEDKAILKDAKMPVPEELAEVRGCGMSAQDVANVRSAASGESKRRVDSGDPPLIPEEDALVPDPAPPIF